jgi:hypothetical protein
VYICSPIVKMMNIRWCISGTLLCSIVYGCSESSFRGSAKAPTKEPPKKEIPIVQKNTKEPSEKVGSDGPRTGRLEEGNTDPQPPREGCQAFFTGALPGDRYIRSYMERLFSKTPTSEWVGEGSYPSNAQAFPNSVKYTFDGVAFDKGTRVVIYSEPDFKGEVLLDQRGPYVIANFPQPELFDEGHAASYEIYYGRWDDHLEKKFPPSVRNLAPSSMHAWDKGSLKIFCED